MCPFHCTVAQGLGFRVSLGFRVTRPEGAIALEGDQACRVSAVPPCAKANGHVLSYHMTCRACRITCANTMSHALET